LILKYFIEFSKSPPKHRFSKSNRAPCRP